MKMLMWFACTCDLHHQTKLAEKNICTEKPKFLCSSWSHIYLLSWAWTSYIYIYMGTSWSWSYGSWIYNYLCNQCLMLCVRIPLRRGVLDTTLCDKVCQWFSLGSPVSFTNKTDCHEITEIMLKVELNTMNVKPNLNISYIDTNQLMSLIISPTYKCFFFNYNNWQEWVVVT